MIAPMPSASSSAPMVRRATPVAKSVPTVPSNKPKSTMASARTRDARASVMAIVSSSTMNMIDVGRPHLQH